jgi:hypothetical protein
VTSTASRRQDPHHDRSAVDRVGARYHSELLSILFNGIGQKPQCRAGATYVRYSPKQQRM